jgi:exodeoxyribonuclease VIII
MLDISLDLETMARGAGGAIVSIGAVEFDLRTCKMGDVFYRTIDLKSCVDAGLTIEAETVMWWMEQSDPARKTLVRNTMPLTTALSDFAEWLALCGPTNDIRIWGNGPSFDNTMLGAAYRACHIEQPWKFWNDRCFRTVCGLYQSVERRPRQGTHHNALDDAIYQAEHMIHIAESVRARR